MLHLVDADVLIVAANGFFQLERVPQFWNWLIEQGGEGNVAIPREIWEEVKGGRDLLAQWARSDQVKDNLLLAEEAQREVVSEVVTRGYASDLTDAEVIELGRDPFLIGYALVSPADRCVVTNEVSKPGKLRGRRHIPDVCQDLGVTCMNTVGLINSLDFRIS